MMFDEQNTNDDGSGAYCFNKGNDDVYSERKMTESLETMALNVNNFDVVNYHFRNSTGGKVDVSNVHLWKIGKWVFCHNGTANSYKCEDDCDSLGLFKDMLRKGFLSKEGKISIKAIKKLIGKTQFWGRFIIINSETNKMWFFGDFHAYLLDRSYIVITSGIATFERKDYVQEQGISFAIENEIEIEKLESEIDGIVEYTFEHGFGQIDNKFKEVYKFDWKKNDKKAIIVQNNEKKIEEYYAGANEGTEYIGSNNYQIQLDILDKKLQKVVSEISGNFTGDNIKKYDKAQEEYEQAVDELDAVYFYGVS